jgi:purine-binding chemotaxis protein CheW
MTDLVKTDAGSRLEEDENASRYLTFLLGEELYAVSILKVKEIIEYDEVTPMPMMPDFICGAINIRGRAVPVIDLAARLGLSGADISRRTCIVVVEVQGGDQMMNVGVIVDSVSRVINLKPEDIERTPSISDKIRTDFMLGMGKIEDKFVILLDIGKVMSMEDLQVLSRAQEASV